MKQKLTIAKQVEHLKSKGVLFNVMNEAEARRILSESTYYFKLKAYAKNYPKDKNGLYENLEFASLYEMSKIDLMFRNFLLKLTLNIEHLIKTKLLSDFSASTEDGYQMVKDFFAKNPKVYDYVATLQSANRNGGNYDIAKHYEDELPLWALAEILQFNDLVWLYRFFYSKHKELLDGKTIESHKMSLDSVKWLRNMSAHNNCILIKLNSFESEGRRHLVKKLASSKKRLEHQARYSLDEMIKNKVAEAFLETWSFFLAICRSEAMREYAKEDLDRFFDYSKKEEKLICRKSNQNIDNFFTFLERASSELFIYRQGLSS